jgi:hypothetical protein
MSMVNLTPSQLRQAANLKERIAGLEKELQQLLGTKAPAVTPPPAKKKGGMSAAGKAKIAAAQKLRWAKIKGVTKPAVKASTMPAKKKFKMSAAAKAKISAAAKARWAAKKAAEAKK